MITARAYATPEVDPEALGCWRSGFAGTGNSVCNRRPVNAAGVCDDHAAEMRSWTGQPVPDLEPDVVQPPAVDTWMEKLEQQLDQAIRSAA